MGSDEAELAFGTADETALRILLPDLAELVIKNAQVSAVALRKDGSRVEVPTLAVGYFSGTLSGLDQRACPRRGHISAACTPIVLGDRGDLPDDGMLNALLRCQDAEWTSTRGTAAGFSSPLQGSVPR